MRPHTQTRRELRLNTNQRGIVLFVALIALVTMMLAAVALIRSVDTSTIIAGNLAFKQSATHSANVGLESAVTWLRLAPSANLNSDSAANADMGYYANPRAGSVTDDATWLPANSAPATGTGIAADGTDTSGNTINYIIERMCNGPGTAGGLPTAQNCYFGANSPNTNSHGVPRADEAGNPLPPPSPIYRVTIKVSGPKNTVSYIQAFTY